MRYQLLLSMPTAKIAIAVPPLGTCGTLTEVYVPVRLNVEAETYPLCDQMDVLLIGVISNL